MLTVWWVNGRVNSGVLPTHDTLCGASYAQIGESRAREVGRSRRTTWPTRYLAPGVAGTELYHQRLVLGRGARQLSRGGLLGTRGIYKRTSTAYGHAAAPWGACSPHLHAGARRRFRQKNGASTKKALFPPSSACSGTVPTT